MAKGAKWFLSGFMTVSLILATVSPALAAPVQSGFEVWPSRVTNDIRKAWTVKFTAPVDKASITGTSVYLTNDNNTPLNVSLVPSADGTEVKVVPLFNYTENTEYRLYIAGGVTSQNGLFKLAKPIVVPFTYLVNSKMLISADYSSFLTNLKVFATTDVAMVKANGLEMHYEGNNSYSLGLVGMKQGSVVTVQAFNSSGQVIDTQKYTIQ